MNNIVYVLYYDYSDSLMNEDTKFFVLGIFWTYDEADLIRKNMSYESWPEYFKRGLVHIEPYEIGKLYFT